MRNYRIAGHLIALDFNSATAGEELLPNLAPFRCDGTEGKEVTGEPVLVVSVADTWEWTEREKEIGLFDVGGSNHAVYRTKDGGYEIAVYDSTEHLCSRMQSSPTFSQCHVTVYDGTESQRNYGLNNCLMMAYAFATATMDTLLVHSSVIRCEGKGYLMTAPSGTGKSTHTHLWYTTIPGCDLMNDDNPIIRIIDGQAIVYGSPWSGKTPCYRNIQAPIGAIVRIQQRPENTIRRMKPVESFATLLPACSNMKWDARIYNSVCDSITKIIRTCSIWELGCLPDSDAAILCHDTITEEHRA